MKYIKCMTAVAFLLLFVVGCSKTYPDYEQFISDIINSQEEFLSRIGSASNPEEIAEAADWFSARLLELDNTGRMLKKKHPESSGWESNPPDTLKDDWDRFHARWSEFADRWELEMKGDDKYQAMLHDPRVKAAFIKLSRTLDSVKFL